MLAEKNTPETLAIQKAVQLIHDMFVNNEERLEKTEEQSNQMCAAITLRLEAMETRIDNMQSGTSELQKKITSALDEDKQKFDEIKQQCNEIMEAFSSTGQSQSAEMFSFLVSPIMHDVSSYCSSFLQMLFICDFRTHSRKNIRHPCASHYVHHENTSVCHFRSHTFSTAINDCIFLFQLNSL